MQLTAAQGSPLLPGLVGLCVPGEVVAGLADACSAQSIAPIGGPCCDTSLRSRAEHKGVRAAHRVSCWKSEGQALLIADRYRLDEPIGKGGMGQVWRATDEILGRPVAVKVLTLEADETAVQRF